MNEAKWWEREYERTDEYHPEPERKETPMNCRWCQEPATEWCALCGAAICGAHIARKGLCTVCFQSDEAENVK